MLPQRVQKNQTITADLLNKIIDSIRECQIQSGVGYAFSRTSGGTTLSIKTTKGATSGAAGQKQCPFDVSVEVATDGMDISLSAGTVNGLMPSNNFDKINAPTNGKRYVVINCDSNGKNVTSASWAVEGSIPVPPIASVDTAPATFGILVAAISGTEVYKTIPCLNIIAKVAPSIQEDRDTYTAGQRNYKQYYQWVF